MNDFKSNIEKNVKKDINNGINKIFYGNPSKESYKAILLGDSGIWSKASFLKRIINDQIDPNVNSTTGGNYTGKTFQLKNGKEILIEFWDTPLQHIYKNYIKYYFKNITNIVILGYDITNSESFDEIKTFWYNFAKENSEPDLIYLLGNKIDIIKKRRVPIIDVQNFSKENNIKYFEISCLTSSVIQKFMDDITNEL